MIVKKRKREREDADRGSIRRCACEGEGGLMIIMLIIQCPVTGRGRYSLGSAGRGTSRC